MLFLIAPAPAVGAPRWAAGLPRAPRPPAAGGTGQSQPFPCRLLRESRTSQPALNLVLSKGLLFGYWRSATGRGAESNFFFLLNLLVEPGNPSSQFLALLLSLLGWSRFNCPQREGFLGACSSSCASIIVCTKHSCMIAMYLASLAETGFATLRPNFLASSMIQC